MKKDKDATSGSIMIETSIVLPLFILVFLFIYGIFTITSAQNQMTHSLIQASKSLSLDSYSIENIASYDKAQSFWSDLGGYISEFLDSSNDEKYFTSSSDWYNEGVDTTVVKNRFIGYLTGGDESAADEKLENFGVIGGLDGISFEMQVVDEDLTITMKYEIQIWFDAFDLGKIPMKQTITTRLWK